MDTPPRNSAGAPVERCADDEACTVLTCAVCLKEVPADAIRVTDAQDYVYHFCGLDCLEAWRKQASAPR
ncbi:MAG: DUF3330 domain-containing protein [Thiobacillus sp.]